ncbi:DUF2121 family protein [Methanobrevibacter sp.]|jgi:hypothetical protein|uniref:DUF2121 family protein n=1 Tax=Methanobrevibacter sp. TaxID=66852 RepID=UPI002E772E77|nr:DUF2121 domain-containing protein [Methanobrevibacter sp.]MEE1336457.1 DUF2121 domain-containing protein [Methanobrevibacter sp.]MEE3444529.1 DUF2121 domain-containing protein [Methanobrevibacter sp.]
MSLIIAYIGKKGCVIAADKRRIAFFGEKENRELLEADMYSGDITTDEELYKRAEELDVVLKISDDASKVRTVEDVALGEVTTRGSMETKRKRIYGTTNAYQIVELSGSKVTNITKGSSSIIVFGNKIAKSLANDLIQKRWKPSFSLKYMGDIFGGIIKDIASKSPSLGKEYDVIIKQDSSLTKITGQNHLDKIVEMDVDLLSKYRTRLTEDLIKINETIQLSSTIIDEGFIGYVDKIDGNMLEVQLDEAVGAFDMNWKTLASPGDNVIVFIEDSGDVEIGDEVVIEDEHLCLKKNKQTLNCDIILCRV